MTGFIYIWRDRKHNRYYIGSHWGSTNDGYICSSRWMKASYKRRPEDFKRRILENVNTDRKTLYDREQYWMNFIKPEEIKVRYYNLSTKAGNHWSSDPEKLKKISYSFIGNKNRLGKQKTKEECEKISKSKLGSKRSIESIEKQRKTITGRKLSKEHVQKIIDSNLGQIRLSVSKRYLIVFPNGEVKTILGLMSFCKKNNLDYVSMNKVSSGKYKSYKNYRCTKIE